MVIALREVDASGYHLGLVLVWFGVGGLNGTATQYKSQSTKDTFESDN